MSVVKGLDFRGELVCERPLSDEDAYWHACANVPYEPVLVPVMFDKYSFTSRVIFDALQTVPSSRRLPVQIEVNRGA